MAILKANGKILKANGKILKAGGGDIFFLTYFENFDESTGTDTPIIGEPYTLDIQKQYLTKSSLNLFGIGKYFFNSSAAEPNQIIAGRVKSKLASVLETRVMPFTFF